MVLLKGDSTCRAFWKLGKVEQLLPGDYEKVGAAAVTSTTEQWNNSTFEESGSALKSHFLRISRIERHSQKIEFFFILPKHPFG